VIHSAGELNDRLTSVYPRRNCLLKPSIYAGVGSSCHLGL